MSKSQGRRKGSRNKGYFFRTGRGWYTKDKSGRFVPLADETGERLRDQRTPEATVREAYLREQVKQRSQPKEKQGNGTTVEEVCNYYLKFAKRESRASTLKMRADTLFDFCYGLPAKWREKSEAERAELTAKDKIHPGYARMPAAELCRHHLQTWLDAHPNWTDHRSRLQAVRRVLTLAVDDGLIEAHKIDKFRISQGRARVTYLTPEAEAAIIEAARPAFRIAFRVLIRTGMRPSELAAITPAHIVDHGERMEIRFKGEKSKNGKVRVVRITDSATIETIRTQSRMNGPGPIFRTQTGNPWKVHYLSACFRRAKRKAEKKGVKFDADTCVYSARHTFAKRALTGYWTGKPINMELLASLMGNTPQVCARHYADILKENSGVTDLLWAAC